MLLVSISGQTRKHTSATPPLSHPWAFIRIPPIQIQWCRVPLPFLHTLSLSLCHPSLIKNMFINSFCLIMHKDCLEFHYQRHFNHKITVKSRTFCHLRICSTENIHLKVCAKKLSVPLFSCYKFISPPSVSLPLDFQDKLMLCHPVPMILLPLPPNSDYKQYVTNPGFKLSICSDNLY